MLDQCDPSWAGLGRQIFIAAAATYAMGPFLGPRFYGAGDAYDYLLQVSDYVTQLRLGIWPVFVGQSDFAFNGSIHTLRTAPAYTHLAGLIDLATGRILSFSILQKLTLFGSLLGAAWSMDLAVRRLLGESRANAAAALAALYVLSPGVLAPLYLGDMDATFMTLPWMPWLVVGLVEIGEAAGRWRGWCAWAVGTGGLWWAHAPTATWALVVSGLYWTLAWRPRTWREGRLALGGIGLAAVLSGYVFVSVHLLERSPMDQNPAGMRRYIAHTLLTLQGIFGPRLHLHSAEVESGWQIGLGALGAAWLGLALAWRRRAVQGLIALLVLAVLAMGAWPAFAIWGWGLLPDLVVTTTGNWPYQRLVGWIAAMAVFTAALGLREMAPARSRLAPVVYACLGGLIAWSAIQAEVYHERARRMMRSAEGAAALMAPERVSLSRATAEVLGRPNAFTSMSRVDPVMEYRLVDAATGMARANGVTLRPGLVRPEEVYELNLSAAGEEMSRQRPVVPPGGATFTFDFHGPSPSGILELIQGAGAFDYALNTEGLGSWSVGVRPAERRTFLLRNPDRMGHSIQVLFWPWTPIAPSPGGSPFATLRVRPWLPDEQVVRILSLIPAQIEVEADRAEWLESPKFWIPGYRARVDGRPEAIVRSGLGLVAVAVPKGIHRIEITYRGPWLLCTAYAVSLAAWLSVLGAVIGGWVTQRGRLGWEDAVRAV
jgi:hypothetical protein